MPILYSSHKLRPRQGRDYYPTEPDLAEAALELVPDDTLITDILDPGCGTGVWGAKARRKWPTANIVGVDIELDSSEPDLKSYTCLYKGDFRQVGIEKAAYQLVIGNPPYKYSEDFIRKSWEALEPMGLMIFLMPLQFLGSQKRSLEDDSLFPNIHPWLLYVLPKRPSFTGDGKTDATEYGLWIWRKGYRGPTALFWYDWRGRTICA